MAIVLGTRVVRGPDWQWDDQDHGEGHVGTVVFIGKGDIADRPEKTVLVLWDMGRKNNYRAGFNRSYDLRIFDNAQTDVVHPDVSCMMCRDEGIHGIRWKCFNCFEFNLCTPCFMYGKHDIGHQFQRFITKDSAGRALYCRRGARKVEAIGTFPGALVQRGNDWKYGEQDGGDSSRPGYMVYVQGWGDKGNRAAAGVKWPGKTNESKIYRYRLGIEGKVDIKCKEEGRGGTYYPDLLPNLGGTEEFQVDDTVVIQLSKDTRKSLDIAKISLARETQEVAGEKGVVKEVTNHGELSIDFLNGQTVQINPIAVRKVSGFSVGDRVRLVTDQSQAENLQRGHGGWNHSMRNILGREAEVEQIYSDGDVKVKMEDSSRRLLLHPACLTLVESAEHRAMFEQNPEGETEINPKEAIMNGTAPWNRSRIMVIGPAGVGKTSLIRRLTGQKFNPHEKSTKGAEQDVVTKSAVSSWVLVNDSNTAKDDLIQSIAMDHSSRSHSPCFIEGEGNRSDSEITGSDRSLLGRGRMSEATKENAFVTGDADNESDNDKIAEISQGITHEEVTKVKSSALDTTYSIWDFGGQEMYYITHPLFLSWRSLYILVIPLHLKLRKEAPRKEDAKNTRKQLKGTAVRTHRTILDLLHFWLMSVYTHAVPESHLGSTYEPKVLLVGTFAGGKSSRIRKKVTSKFQELEALLGSQPYWKQVLSPMCVIDNQFSPTSEVKTIQDRIDGLIQDSEYMKVRKPIKWRTFLTEIEGSDQNTLTVKEARSSMKALGINDDKEVDDVLKFCHDIGHLIYHQGYDLIVLQPQFLNSIVSNIIAVIDDKMMEGDQAASWTDLKEKGILCIELIQAVWEEHNGDPDQLDNIINMMMLFDLICEIGDRPDGKRQFFVPCRSSPKLDESEIHGKDEKVEFTIDFHHFLPDGVLHQFYVRMAQWSMRRNPSIKPTFHCREMVFYIDNVHRVVMTNDIHEGHAIKVMIYAVTPYGAPSKRTTNRISLNEDIIDYLHETLEDLKELWARRIEYRVGIWCPRCAKYKRKLWIQIRDILKDQTETACCDESCAIYVGHIQRAFDKGTTKTAPGKAIPPQGASAAVGEVTTSTARPTEESRDQDFDDHLKTVAKKIHKDIDIDNLGTELGFEPAEIARYIQTNTRHQTVTYMGTLHMLRDWRKRTERSKESVILRRALITINLRQLADD